MLCLLLFLVGSVSAYEYCIIGAGPGGVQTSYYLQKAGLSYVILERKSTPGSFFELYPRRRILISINKRNTGETNTEFNMRHDWNSLLSDDPEMIFKHYSKEMFPPADAFLDYIKDYVERFKLNVHYNTNVEHVFKDAMGKGFTILTDHSTIYQCSYVVTSTGLAEPTDLGIRGKELFEGYDTVSHNPEDFEGQRVLILGKGNSAFETADLIYGRTDYVHLMSRDRVKLSWSTHYVGDVRGVNNALLDTYQLKSLDAVMEYDLKSEGLYFYKNEEGGIMLSISDGAMDTGPYDRVINCLGFNFDPKPLGNLTEAGAGIKPEVKTAEDFKMEFNMEEEELLTRQLEGKYPEMGWDFESTETPGLYYAGTITHGLDKRMSSGGFIHGFRYTARSLAWLLGARNHGIRWPSVKIPLHGIVSYLLKRTNEMNGSYQMFYVLTDVYLRRGDYVEVFHDVPHGLLHKLHELLVEPEEQARDFVAVRLEYGKDFSKIGGDPFFKGRVNLKPSWAHHCNFIHPVMYHFTDEFRPEPVPVRSKMLMGEKHKLHTVEDLDTDFAKLTRHHPAVSNFLSTTWDTNFEYFTPKVCVEKSLTRSSDSAHPCHTAVQPVFQLNMTEAPILTISPTLMPKRFTLEELMMTKLPNNMVESTNKTC